MKKLIIKLVVMAAILLSVLFAYNAVYQKIRYREKAYYTEEKFENVPYGIQVSNVGSSHGVYGFDYSDYADKYITYNFALASQSLSYDYRILKQYEDHLADDGVMFILVSYFSLGMDEETDADFNAKNERYYSFLEAQYIKQSDLVKYITKKYFDVIYSAPDTIVFNLLKADKKGEDAYSIGGKDYDYEKDAQTAYERHIKLMHMDENGNFVVRDEEKDALYGIVELCRKHNIRPILITTPLRDEYNKKYDKKFYDQFHGGVDSICKELNVEYYDYSHDERFIHSYELMRNADHLSPNGAIAFTDILFEDLINK